MKEISRLRALAVAAGTGLALAAVPGVAAAASPGSVPADPITNQDHPADVFEAGLQFFPSTVTISAGESLTFGNYGPYFGNAATTLTEYVPGCSSGGYTDPKGVCSLPRFSTALVDWFRVDKVHGVEDLAPGTYQFYDSVHPTVRGTLIVK